MKTRCFKRSRPILDVQRKGEHHQKGSNIANRVISDGLCYVIIADPSLDASQTWWKGLTSWPIPTNDCTNLPDYHDDENEQPLPVSG